MKAYCFDCKKWVEAGVTQAVEEDEIKDVHFSCLQKHAYCAECGSELYPDEIIDENVSIAHDAYREAMGIITIAEMKEILRNYNIGCRPLSLLLGWGENTIERQMKHTMPNKEMSNRLKELLDPVKMRTLLVQNESRISSVAYRKAMKAVENMLKPDISAESITNQTGNILNKWQEAFSRKPSIISSSTTSIPWPSFAQSLIERPGTEMFSTCIQTA